MAVGTPEPEVGHPGLRDEIRRSLRRRVGVYATQRIGLAVPPDLVHVPVDLVGRDDHLGLDAWRVLDGLKDIERAQSVRLVRVARVSVRLTHEGLSRKMQHDVWFHGRDGLPCGGRVADVDAQIAEQQL